MWLAVWQPTPRAVDVTFTKIAGYVRVRILMNRWFFRIFGIHTFYATATFYTPGTHALNTCSAHACGALRLVGGCPHEWLWCSCCSFSLISYISLELLSPWQITPLPHILAIRVNKLPKFCCWRRPGLIESPMLQLLMRVSQEFGQLGLFWKIVIRIVDGTLTWKSFDDQECNVFAWPASSDICQSYFYIHADNLSPFIHLSHV